MDDRGPLDLEKQIEDKDKEIVKIKQDNLILAKEVDRLKEENIIFSNKNRSYKNTLKFNNSFNEASRCAKFIVKSFLKRFKKNEK